MDSLRTSTSSVLVVDDFAPWRRFVCLKLQSCPELSVVGEASDGLDAVQKAQRLLVEPAHVFVNWGMRAGLKHDHLAGANAALHRVRESG